jgi:P27 family predicted phage terminase small subunit
MAGRKPKPTHLKLLQGNPGKRRLNTEEPKPPAELPPVPELLSDGAKQEWARLGQQLLTLGLLTSIDRAAFAAYCVLWARWAEAEEALKKTGPVVRSPSGYAMLSPFYTIANQSLSQLRSYLVEFGMTPSSRSRTSVRSPEDTDPLEEFLFGQR